MNSMKIVLLVGVLASIVALVYSSPLPVAASGGTEHAEESGSGSGQGDKQTPADSSGAIKVAAEDSLKQVVSSTASKMGIKLISGQDDPLSGVKLDTSGQDDTLFSVKQDTSGQDDTLSSVKVDTSGQDDTLSSVKVDTSGQDDTLSSVKQDTSGQDDTLSVSKLDTKDVPLSVLSEKLSTGVADLSTSDKMASPSALIGKLNTDESGLKNIGQQVSPSVLIGEVDTLVDTAASTSDKGVSLTAVSHQLDAVPAVDSHERDSSSNPSGEKAASSEADGRLEVPVPRDGQPVATASSVVSQVAETSGGGSTNGAAETSGEHAQQTATQHSHNQQHANGQQTRSGSEQHHTHQHHGHGHRGSKSTHSEGDHNHGLIRPYPDITARIVDSLRDLMS